MSKSYSEITKYYAIFIIGSLAPQILGFGGSNFDTIWKLFVIVFLVAKTSDKSNIFQVTAYGIKYMALYLFCSVIIDLVNTSNLISDCIVVLMRLMLFVLLFETPRKQRKEPKNVLLFYEIFAHFILVACIYNMIINFDKLVNIASISVYGGEDICSFFDNKNTFGAFLMFGFLAITILCIVTQKKKWYLYMIIIFINEMMALCRTAIFMTLILFVLSMLCDKKRRGRNVFILLGVSVALWIMMKQSNVFSNFIVENILGDTKSLDTREDYVSAMKPLLNGIHLLFGYGREQSTQLAMQYTGNQYYHNTYLQIFMIGGMIEFTFFLASLIYSMIYSIRASKKNKLWGMLCILSIFVYLIYAYIESVILFDTPSIAMTATIFVVTMPIIINQKLGYIYEHNYNKGEKICIKNC